MTRHSGVKEVSKQLKVSSCLHTGGCYEINLLVTKDNNLCYTVNKNTAYDMNKVRLHQKRTGKRFGTNFIDVFDSSNL